MGARFTATNKALAYVRGWVQVADLLVEARADDVAIIDVRHRCPFTDYMVGGG